MTEEHRRKDTKRNVVTGCPYALTVSPCNRTSDVNTINPVESLVTECHNSYQCAFISSRSTLLGSQIATYRNVRNMYSPLSEQYDARAVLRLPWGFPVNFYACHRGTINHDFALYSRRTVTMYY
jgi:hypothetical protein